MSDLNNTILLERAHEISEQYAGTALPAVIDNLIEQNDLEKLAYVVDQADADLAREDFYGHDTYPGTSVI